MDFVDWPITGKYFSRGDRSCQDPDDDLVLELAVAASAPYIITHNISDFQGSDSMGVLAITPATALRSNQTMTTLSIRVPDSLHRAIKELATKDGYSMNQFLITAAAEKLVRAGDRRLSCDIAPSVLNLKDFDRLLAKVPDCAPDPGDELAPQHSQRTKRPS
jgi:hypothetical protein